MMDKMHNPFEALSKIFIDNQNNFNLKADDLRNRSRILSQKLNKVIEQLEINPFDADLNLYLNIEEESRFILIVAKEVEKQRKKITDSIEMLSEANKVSLNG